MSTVIVDSNVIIDLLTADKKWLVWSSRVLTQFVDDGALVINPVIFAEVSVSFDTLDDANLWLSESFFKREEIPYEAAFLAGKAFSAYRKRGGDRMSLLPDFLIGAHAAVCGYSILTRDDRRYRAYFPKVRLITPTTKL